MSQSCSQGFRLRQQQGQLWSQQRLGRGSRLVQHILSVTVVLQLLLLSRLRVHVDVFISGGLLVRGWQRGLGKNMVLKEQVAMVKSSMLVYQGRSQGCWFAWGCVCQGQRWVRLDIFHVQLSILWSNDRSVESSSFGGV